MMRGYSTEALRAAAASKSGPGHARAAAHLLTLPTEADRRRAANLAHLAGNLRGGVFSENVRQAVRWLQANPEGEHPDERYNRELLERERAARDAHLTASVDLARTLLSLRRENRPR